MTWAFRLPHEASAPYLANCKDMSTFQFPVKIPGWKLKGTHKPLSSSPRSETQEKPLTFQGVGARACGTAGPIGA